MKRIALTLTLVLAFATAAFAQQGPPPGAPPRPAGDPLATYLNLTADQKAVWEAAHEAFDATVQPLFEKQRTLQEAIGAALESKSSDACSIGAQMLAIRAIGDQIKAARDTFEAKRASVLTAEQKSKLEAFEAAAQFLRDHEGPPRPPR
jgi:Spy/CpxP family protein refolding chaperone